MVLKVEKKTTTGAVCDPNGVNRPLHYNTHPSGIEAIEAIRGLTCNYAQAYKYVFRRGEKVEAGMTPEQAIRKDLAKAKWYLNDEFMNQAKAARNNADTQVLQSIAKAEEHPQAREFYLAFVLAAQYQTGEYLVGLMTALETLEKSYDQAQSTGG